jgi:UDP-glucose 4-epimerase
VSAERTLIVGGGFLGCALARALRYKKRGVTVLSPNTVSSECLEESLTVKGRQEDEQLVATLLREHDAVIHAAWGTTPSSSAAQPATEVTAGLAPWVAFLEILQRFPAVQLLFLSSGGTVYGDPDRLPVTEDCPLRPLSCHGAGKAAAELFLAAQAPTRTARWIVLRPSNVYGPGQPWRTGFGVLRHLLQCAIEDRPFTLFGDGSQVRDYLYIDDLANGVLQLLEAPDVSGTYNIGSGVGISLLDLISLVERITGKRLHVESRPTHEGDVGRIVLDVEKIREAIGWTPVTSLSEGVTRTWHWLRNDT